VNLKRERSLTLTPAERQQILRRLKRGPAVGREDLVRYAEQVRREVVGKREKGQ
jgi:hypothetical protein